MGSYDIFVWRTQQVAWTLIEQLYAPFVAWNDLQRLILVLGIVAFVGYMVARPPRRAIGRFVVVNNVPVMLVSTLAAAFVIGLIVGPWG